MALRTIGVWAFVLGGIFSSLFAASTIRAATIFYDGFESGGFSAWDAPIGNNFSPSAGTCRQGPDSNTVAAKITGENTPHGQALKKTIPTTGYQNISVSFCYKWDVLEAGNIAVVEYTADGTTWTPIKTIDNTTVKHMFYAADDTELAIGTTPPGDIPTPFPVTLEELSNYDIPLPANAANKPNFGIRIREQLGDGDDFVWIDDFRVSGDVIATPTNLIQNPSLETASGDPGIPSYWFKGGWGNNNRVLTYPVAGQHGVKAAKAEITSYINGDAKWFFEEVPVTPGQTYSFSSYFMSNVPSYLAVQFRMTNSTFTYLDLGQEAASPSSWENIQTNFTVPANVISLTIFHLIRQTGYVTIDNYSLVAVTDPSDFDAGKVSLTFDDALISIYTAGIPILDAVGFKSTQYIPSGLLNTPGSMTTSNVLTMQSNGHDIAGHTITHANLTTLSSSQMQTEIGGGRRDLIQLGGTPVNNFAYPLGAYNDTVKNTVRNSRFLGARTVDAGFNTKNTDKYALKVKQVNRSTPFSEVKTAIDTAMADKTWAILVFHAIDHGSSTFGTTPEMLQQIVDYLDQQNTDVITVSQGLSLMNPTPPPPADTAAPVITMNGTSPIDVSQGSTYSDAGASAFDNVDGDIGADIVVTNNVNTSVLGTYEVRYNVSDIAGNAARQVVRTVNVVAGTPQNLIQNPSLETASTDPSIPLNWFKGGWGSNTRVLTYPVAGQEGVRAAKAEITSYANGDAKWHFKEVSVTPGYSYSFSHAYQSNITTHLAAQFKMSNNSYTYVDLAALPASPSTWQTTSLNFVIPANAVSMTVFHIVKQVGWVTVDNYSLTSTAPLPNNLIANPSVEIASSIPTIPQAWQNSRWGTNAATFTYPAAGIDGAKSVKIDITSFSSGDAKWFFNEIPFEPGASYTFGDSYIATIPSKAVARFALPGGAYQYLLLSSLPAASTPTPISFTFTPPSNTISITVFHLIEGVGSLTADNFSLTKQ